MAAAAATWPAGASLADGRYNNRVRVNLLEFLYTGVNLRQASLVAASRLFDAYMAAVASRARHLAEAGGPPELIAAYHERTAPWFVVTACVACLVMGSALHVSTNAKIERKGAAGFVVLQTK